MPLVRPNPLSILLAAILVATALVGLPRAATAQLDTSTRDRLETDIERYEQLLRERRAEIGSIEEALGETQAELDARIAERDRIAAELQRVQGERETILQEIARLEEERRATEERIAQREAELEGLKAQIQQLLLNLYHQRSSRFARVLADAESFHDLQVKNHYLSLLAEQDVALVQDLNTVIADLTDLQALLSEQIATQSEAENRLAQTEEELDRTRARLQSAINELDATRQGQLAQRRALLEAQTDIENRLGNLESALAAEIRRLQEEERRLRERAEAEQFVANRQATLREADAVRARIDNLTAPVTVSGSEYVRPVDGEVATGYGENGYSFVAFRSRTANAAVRAVQDGVVLQIQSLGANDGWMVALNHGSELVTVYTNLRPPVVQVGDRVEQGQVLGYLGGGSLIPSDILRLYLRVAGGKYVDPVAQLGL